MTDKPRRPILHLKFPPANMPEPPGPPAPRPPRPSPFRAAPRAAPRVAKAPVWKCKPCGKAFEVPAELADDESVRCPACNARLGDAGDFRAETNLDRLRARLAAR